MVNLEQENEGEQQLQIGNSPRGSAGQRGVAVFTHPVREMAPERPEAQGNCWELMGTTANSALCSEKGGS